MENILKGENKKWIIIGLIILAVLLVLVLFFVLLVAAIAIPAILHNRQEAQFAMARSYQTELTMAAAVYTSDNGKEPISFKEYVTEGPLPDTPQANAPTLSLQSFKGGNCHLKSSTVIVCASKALASALPQGAIFTYAGEGEVTSNLPKKGQ